MKKFRLLSFTLVELIVAITILAMVSTVVAGTLAGFQRSYAKVQKLSAALERGKSLDYVAELIRNAIPFTWPDTEDNNTERLVFDGQSDSVWFTARQLPGSDGKGAFLFVRLYLNDDHELCCDYYDKPFLPWGELEEQEYYKTEVLAKNVDELKMLYADWTEEDELDWLEVWDQDDEEYENRMPAAIQFAVTFSDGKTLRYLRRTAGISAFSGVSQ